MGYKKNGNIIAEFNKLIKHIYHQIDVSKDKNERKINMFRLQSIKKVLEILENYPDKIKSSSQLENIKNIGKKSLDRIDEIIKTGKLSEIQDSTNDKLEKLIDKLEKVHGIGRKNAKEIIDKYNIKSLEQLIENVDKYDLPDTIKKGLKYYGKYEENIPREDIDSTYIYLMKISRKINRNLFVTIAGSYRRLKSKSNDIDVIISGPPVLTELIEYLIKDSFIVESFTSTNVKTKYMGLCMINNKIRRIDIRYIEPPSYYYALLYFTGSGEFNRKMRQVAQSWGYKLNEYGLYDTDGNIFKVKSEKEIFDILKMEYVEPDKR